MKKHSLDSTRFLTAGTKITSRRNGRIVKVMTLTRDYPVPFIIPQPQNEFEAERLHGAAHAYLRHLRMSSIRGDKKSAKRFHEFTTIVIEQFQIANQVQPNLFLALKRSALKWPSFASPNKMVQKYESQFTRELAQTPPLKSHGKQASPDKIETLMAWNLFHRVEGIRTVKGKILGKYEPDSVTQLSIGLPRLTRQTFSKWKRAIEAAFTEELGSDFEQHRYFKKYWGEKADKLSEKESKKQRGLVRREIKKRIFQAFYRLAPES